MNYINISAITSAVVILLYMIKKMKLRHMALYVLSGIFCLLASDVIMSFYGGNMPINTFSLTFSSLAGIPGVVMLTLFKTFLI